MKFDNPNFLVFTLRVPYFIGFECKGIPSSETASELWRPIEYEVRIMANSAHLVRRQSSRDLNPQRSLDRLELKDIKTRIMSMEKNRPLSSYDKTSYGTTNTAFEDVENPLAKVSLPKVRNNLA